MRFYVTFVCMCVCYMSTTFISHPQKCVCAVMYSSFGTNHHNLRQSEDLVYTC